MKKKLLSMVVLAGLISISVQAQKKLTNTSSQNAKTSTTKATADIDATRKAHNLKIREMKQRRVDAAKSGAIIAQKTN